MKESIVSDHLEEDIDDANYHPNLTEKLAFGMGDFWTSIVYTAFSSYLTMFYTDVVGIAAATVAWLLLVVRLIIAVWDIIVGVAVDRTHTKYGKARPWVLWGGILFGLSFIFLFMNPFHSAQAAFTYAFISYFVVNFFYSAVNIPYGSLNSLITNNADERTTLNIFRMTIANIGAIILYIIAMPIINMFSADSATGWTILFGIIGILIPFGYLFTFLKTKERVKPSIQASDTKEHVSIKRQFNALFKNKYWWLTTVMSLVNWIYSGVANGLNAYMAKYVLGNASLLAILGIATVLPNIISIPLSGPIIKKFGKRNAAIIGLILVFPGSLLTLVNTHSTWILMTSIIIRTLGVVPLTAVLNPMLTDVIDYGEWKFGIRADGLIFSANSFGMKVGMGLSSAMVAWILAFSNYNGKLLHQTAATVSSLTNSFVWLPMLVIAIMIVLLFFYDLDKKQPQIVAELKNLK